jgi:hypothetical protein
MLVTSVLCKIWQVPSNLDCAWQHIGLWFDQQPSKMANYIYVCNYKLSTLDCGRNYWKILFTSEKCIVYNL